MQAHYDTCGCRQLYLAEKRVAACTLKLLTQGAPSHTYRPLPKVIPITIKQHCLVDTSELVAVRETALLPGNDWPPPLGTLAARFVPSAPSSVSCLLRHQNHTSPAALYVTHAISASPRALPHGWEQHRRLPREELWGGPPVPQRPPPGGSEWQRLLRVAG